jgi:outer membrane protein TolC
MNFRTLILTCLPLILLCPPTPVRSQDSLSFTLLQAQEYAYDNNYDLKNSRYDVQIAIKMVKENTAIGLPQISGSVFFMDYIDRPTSLIPNFFDTSQYAPKYIEVQFGTKYNLTGSLDLSQLLYSGQYLVGLQTARAYLETEKQMDVKNQIDVRDLVAEAYIAYLIVNESLKILDSTYRTVDQMVGEATVFFEQGLIEQLDVEQLNLNKSTLEANLITTQNLKLIAYNYLKFLLGLKDNQQIRLTDDLDFFITKINRDYLMNSPFDYNFNIDYQLLKKQEHLVFMQYKLAKTAYQPTLAAYLSLSENAQRESFNFFKSDQPWYLTINWGILLNIPIWSSGSRKYNVDQAKLEVDKMKVMDEKVKTSLKIQVETVRNDFNKSYLVFLNKKQSLRTAGKIYEQTVIKYRQGLASSTDLNQRYNQFLITETEYTQAMFDLLKANIRLNKLLEKV